LSRRETPGGSGLWDDVPVADLAGTSTAGDEPPSWALPSWDTIPGAENTPGSAGAVAGSPVSARSTQVKDQRPSEAGTDADPGSPASADPDAEVTERTTPGPSAAFELRILGVSEVTRAVREAVRSQPDLRDLWVEGEVGRVTVSSAGHCYFALKDERSQLACVFFRDDRLASPFEPRTGLRVVVHGRVDVFESQGVYQLYVSSVQPAGFGDLALRFEALKARLAAEGLFDSARKRPLPVRPAVVGVVTSASGAVWHDIAHVVSRRWPLARLVLSPCRVQGDGAAASVVAGLERLARWREQLIGEGRADDAPTVTILARGGGSLEDLWPFNDERVVRAVVAHPVPVVCGVGHEVDVTLVDFAADVRAPTPSAAAELVVPDRIEVAGAVAGLQRRARARMLTVLDSSRREMVAEARALERLRPAAQLAQARERAGALLDRATRMVRNELARRRALETGTAMRLAPAADVALAGRRAVIERLSASLAALGPQATLERGYAIVRRANDGSVVRGPAEAPAGTALRVRVEAGEFGAESLGDAGNATQGSGKWPT
jgi:exodeoxyribonuclease VII large subunit